MKQVTAHVKYVGFRSKEANEKGFFSRDEDKADFEAFLERIEKNSALQHPLTIKARKMIFSLRESDYEAYKRSGKDFKDLVRNTLAEYERKHGVKLDWIANIHAAEGHPHCHVVIKGVSDNRGADGRFKRIVFKKEDLQELKETFHKEFERDAIYHLHERLDVDRTLGDMSKVFESVTKDMTRENERLQREAEMKRQRAARNKGRDR
ncbi:hypothetical protein [Brevibacillus agri]|nr:hypothetical protein [Brevibacillus agri]